MIGLAASLSWVNVASKCHMIAAEPEPHLTTKETTVSHELTTAIDWLDTGHQVMMAVVASTWGSAPRRPGSLMVVRDDGVFEGSVSGGCVEGAVICEAQAMLQDKSPSDGHRALTFSVTSEKAWDVGLACGGEIVIWLFVLSPTDVSTLRSALNDLTTGRSGELRFADTKQTTWQMYEALPAKAHPKADESTHSVPVLAPLTLVIVGAVHIAQHLSVMADACEFDVIIVDPRAAFREGRSFAQATLVDDWPDDYFRQNPVTATTAVVTLTHDPKLDDAALQEILGNDVAYIGCLGSRKTHAARLERLQQRRIGEQLLARIHAPVGLDIAAATPAEIAVSILAEIIQVTRASQ